MKIESEKTYVALAASGRAKVLAGGAAFWSMPEQEIAAFGKDWLISEFVCEADWPSWEMHPHADEFVYLLSGAADFLLEMDGHVERITMRAGEAVLVPQGRWHTAKISTPGRMLFVTRGEGTEHRPVLPD